MTMTLGWKALACGTDECESEEEGPRETIMVD